jgi:hypothetical protein
MPEPLKVEAEDEYFHVRFNDPDRYDTIRTPDWADNVSDSVIEGSEVRMGKKKGKDDWDVETVLIPLNVGEQEAVEKAEKIVEKIRS